MGKKLFIFFYELYNFDFIKQFCIIDIIFNLLGFLWIGNRYSLIWLFIFSIINFIITIIGLVILFKKKTLAHSFFKIFAIDKLIFSVIYLITLVINFILTLVYGNVYFWYTFSFTANLGGSIVLYIIIYILYSWIIYLYYTSSVILRQENNI